MNKDVKQLAIALFLKTNNEKFYTVATDKNLRSNIEGSIEIAKLFFKILEELDEEQPFKKEDKWNIPLEKDRT